MTDIPPTFDEIEPYNYLNGSNAFDIFVMGVDMNINIGTIKNLATLAVSTPMKSCPCNDELFIQHGDHWTPYYAFLYRLAHVMKPMASVELGVHIGMGSGHLCLANPVGIVVGVDINKHEKLDEMVGRFPNFKFHQGDTMKSAQFVKDNIIGDTKIGILFIDSTHNVWVPKAEYKLYSQWFDDVCVVCCDDVAISAMEGFWEWLPGEKYRCDFLHPSVNLKTQDTPGFGVSIIRK